MVTDGLPWLSKQKGKNQGMSPKRKCSCYQLGWPQGVRDLGFNTWGGVPQGFLTASLGISLDLGSSFSLKGPRTPLGHQNFWRLKTIIFLLSFLGG